MTNVTEQPHGKMTSSLGRTLSVHYSIKGYDVLYDHGIKSENVGKIVSWFGKQYDRESEISQIDIAIVERDTKKVKTLIEIEETTDRPKTLIGDIFGVLLGNSIRFGDRKDLMVDEDTTLIVVGISDVLHNTRMKYLLDEVTKIKPHLITGNSKVGNIVMYTFTKAEELAEQIIPILDRLIR